MKKRYFSFEFGKLLVGHFCMYRTCLYKPTQHHVTSILAGLLMLLTGLRIRVHNPSKIHRVFFNIVKKVKNIFKILREEKKLCGCNSLRTLRPTSILMPSLHEPLPYWPHPPPIALPS